MNMTIEPILNNGIEGLVLLELSSLKILDANLSLLEMLGYSKEDLLQKSFQEIEINDNKNLSFVQKVQAIDFSLQKSDVCFKTKIKTKCKRIVNAEIKIPTQLMQGSGQILVSIRLLTEQSESYHQINQFLFATENSPIIIYITDTAGHFVYANPTFERTAGYTLQEIVGKHTRILKSGKQDRNFYKNLWDTALAGKVWQGILINRNKSGGYYHVRSTVAPLLGENKEILNFVCMQENITEQVKLEEKQKKQEQQLYETARLATLGGLVSGVGHEINNPNNFIMMNSSLLLKLWKQLENNLLSISDEMVPNHSNGAMHKLCKKFPVLLEDIYEGSKRIENIVKELRNFAKPDTQEYKDNVSVNSVLTTSIFLLENKMKHHTLLEDVIIEKDLPLIIGNELKLKQAFVALIKNACEAMHKEKGVLKIIAKDLTEKQCIEIMITDNGIGMTKEELEQVKNPFFTTKQVNGHIGLGASISNTIIQQHQGSLIYQSEKNCGTTILITLPYKK